MSHISLNSLAYTSNTSKRETLDFRPCFLLRSPIISSFLSTAQSFNVLTEKNNIDN